MRKMTDLPRVKWKMTFEPPAYQSYLSANQVICQNSKSNFAGLFLKIRPQTLLDGLCGVLPHVSEKEQGVLAAPYIEILWRLCGK